MYWEREKKISSSVENERERERGRERKITEIK